MKICTHYLSIFITIGIAIANGQNTTTNSVPTTDETTSTGPTTTIHVTDEIGPNTNFSAGPKQLYPTTTELVTPYDQATFDANKFFNGSDLADHGELNMTKVREKFNNGSTASVSPINATSATFELTPRTTENGSGNQTNADGRTTQLNIDSTTSNNSDIIRSMANRLNQMGLKNVSIVPGEQSSHTYNTTDNVHINHTIPNTPYNWTTSISNTTQNATTSNYTLPQNPYDPLQSQYGIIIHASVFFTSGTTTPRDPYPKDRYNVTFWKNETNQLTNKGKFQSYQLGKWLATRYNFLLNRDLYDLRTVRIDSSQLDSVFMSAESLLAGLFPPRGKQVWNKALLWQPVPIHSVPLDQDQIVSMSKACRQYDISVESVNDLSEWVQIFNSQANTLYVIGNNTGLSFSADNMYSNLLQTYNCYNDLTIERQYNLSLPEWTKNVYPEPLRTLAVKFLQFCTYTDPMKKFKAGPFLKALINDIKNKVTNHTAQKLHLYSGNAYGLSAIMNTLGIFNFVIPPPASALLIELRKKNDQYIITLSYKNSTTDLPYVLPNVNNEIALEYTKFISFASNYTLSNWDDECNIISFADLAYSTPLLIAGLIVIIVLIFLFILLMVKCCKCMSKRKGKISYR